MTVFFCAAIFFSSCDSDDPSKNRASAIKKLYNSGKVKIAIANSFDQNFSKMWEGAVLAQEKINGEHMLPVQLELIKFNDGGDTIKGMSTAYKITSDPEICAVVGHGYSDVSLSCSLIYQYYGLLMFNFISTAHTLTDRNNPIIFSNMPRDVDFADEISLLCEKNGYKSVLIYYLENISGTSISNFFEISCSKRGISVVNRDSYDITTSQQEFERTIRRWKNNFMFDAIFLAGRMPSIQQIIVTLRDNGINWFNVFVDKPFIPLPPDWDVYEKLWPTAKLFTYYPEWYFERMEEYVFECHSSGVPHNHCMDVLVARKKV